LAGALAPTAYIRSVGLEPFEWQQAALEPGIKRLMLLTARQSGKSTVVAASTLQKARFTPGSLILIICPAQDQSKELMKKIENFMLHYKELPEMTHDAIFEKEFVNGSRIIALPGSERSVRSYSGPSMIIVDEASRVLDETYRALRPMMVGADTELVLMSTPFGKRGFFYEEWTKGVSWKKILVKPHYVLDGSRPVEGPEEHVFRREYRKHGIEAYYSPRHDVQFLLEELVSLGPLWFRQEYLCEFVETIEELFRLEDIQAALSDEITPLFEKEEAHVFDEGIERLRV
jgi:hypothetical protein